MFIVPLSLFLIATYLRPRTQAELSYMITAVECLGGLWCLLFAPFQIQLSLVGFLLLRNTDSLKSLIEKRQSSNKGYLDLSDTSSPTIDIESNPVESYLLTPGSSSDSGPEIQLPQSLSPTAIAQKELVEVTSQTSTLANSIKHLESSSVPDVTSQSPALVTKQPPYKTQGSPTAIAVFQPQKPSPESTVQKKSETQSPKGSIVIPTQVVVMQYRGTTYLKSIPTHH